MSADDFQIVTGKKASRANRNRRRHALNNHIEPTCDVAFNKDIVTNDICSYRMELMQSDFICSIINDTFMKSGIMPKSTSKQVTIAECDSRDCQSPNASSSLQNIDDRIRTMEEAPVEHLVCYGIGSIVSSVIARYQLSFLLILREKLKIPADYCFVYDPVLSQAELEIIRQSAFNTLTENEEAKRCVKEKTLFYMPHCGKALYNNLLWANWSPHTLHNVLIVGNSFSHMQVCTPERFMKQEGEYILKIIPYIKEFPLPNIFRHRDIFNDTSLHIVDKTKLSTVDQTFWDDCPCPMYKDGADDVILTE